MISPSELRKMIREELNVALQIIASGNSGNTSTHTEDIANLFPGMPTVTGRPIMQPYGISSRAPSGKISVTAQQGSHPGNKMVLGHRDATKPAVEAGETQLYNEFGQAVYLKDGSVCIGIATAANPAVLGNEIKAMLQLLITLEASHTHIGNLGYATSAPIEAAQFTEIQTDNVDNDLILSQLVFLDKGA